MADMALTCSRDLLSSCRFLQAPDVSNRPIAFARHVRSDAYKSCLVPSGITGTLTVLEALTAICWRQIARENSSRHGDGSEALTEPAQCEGSENVRPNGSLSNLSLSKSTWKTWRAAIAVFVWSLALL